MKHDQQVSDLLGLLYSLTYRFNCEQYPLEPGKRHAVLNVAYNVFYLDFTVVGQDELCSKPIELTADNLQAKIDEIMPMIKFWG